MRRSVLLVFVLLVGCGRSSAIHHIEDGMAKEKAGNLTAAIADYSAAVQAAPSMPEAHYDLGLAYWRLHHFDSAVSEFREALRLRPGFIEASEGLSRASAAIEARQESFAR